jgi:hypothetical protein
MNAFMRAWKRDFNFRLTIVFGVFYFLGIALTGKVHAVFIVPYFTCLIYGMVKMGLERRAFKKWMKRNEELQVKFEAAMGKGDHEEAEKVLDMLTNHLTEQAIKDGIELPKKEEL